MWFFENVFVATCQGAKRVISHMRRAGRRQCDGAWSGHLTDTWRPEATAEHDRARTDTWRLEAAERGRSTADTLADTPGGVSRLSATLFL
jgi:hypothetical protein